MLFQYTKYLNNSWSFSLENPISLHLFSSKDSFTVPIAPSLIQQYIFYTYIYIYISRDHQQWQ